MISVIVPVYNEEGSVVPLHGEIVLAMHALGRPFEVVFVDDGSTDGTLAALKTLSPIRIVSLRRNFGQTAALDAGIKASRATEGDIIVTLDGDGQNDPRDIALLVAKLDQGYDVVSGWRRTRRDSLGKRMISRGAWLVGRLLVRDHIHDSGCGLKAYRRECFAGLGLYGESHRFIVGMLAAQGFRIAEVETNHRPRLSGRTKYTLSRALKGFLDMIGVWFWRSYGARPLHLLGGLGLVFSLVGGTVVGALFILRLLGVVMLHNSIWPLAGFFLVLVGIELLVSGIIADIAVKSHYHSGASRPYYIRETIDNR